MKKEGSIVEFVVIILCCVLALWLIQVCGPYSHYVRSGTAISSGPK